jgi:hypothetical protein
MPSAAMADGHIVRWGNGNGGVLLRRKNLRKCKRSIELYEEYAYTLPAYVAWATGLQGSENRSGTIKLRGCASGTGYR